VGAVLEATEASLEAATHLTEMDAGAVQALRSLAKILDAMLGDDDGGGEREVKFDNVTIPTYLKYCESLGLTPAGREKLALKKDEGAKRGKLVSLQGGIPRPSSA
jgi:hypothetical protein